MTEPSGPQWVARFPGSTSVDDLVDPFKSDFKRFLDCLDTAGASVEISATYRPPERAYLMHYACWIAGFKDADGNFHSIEPSAAPPFAGGGVDIDWTCGGNEAKALNNANLMKNGYGIVFPASLASRHTERLAVDMTVKWWTRLTFVDANGDQVPLAPNDLPGLYPVGASYGVHKLIKDRPHWSNDGH